MNYSDFTVEDFVWDERFRSWVLDPDAESDAFWQEWITANPYRRSDIEDARQLITALKVTDPPISDLEVDLAIGNIMHKINQEDQTYEAPQSKTGFSFRIRRSLVFMISFLVLFGAGAILLQRTYFSNGNAEMVVQVNNGISPLKFTLPDGSIITLEKNAEIKYAESFKGLPNRKVYLQGEAFFEIEKDAEKPFIVYSNGLITKVLGTKFRIRSIPGEKRSVVEVTSGIVAVYSLADKDSEDELNGEKLNSVILTRNQKASYSNEDRTVIASVVENPVATDNAVFNYEYSETPIGEIFRNIEEGYGIKIIYDEKDLAERTLTANLAQTSMFQKLDIICKVLSTRYEIIDGKVIIYSK